MIERNVETGRQAVLHAAGGPDSFTLENVQVPVPAAGEVRIRQSFAGVNFIDVYQRSGLYGASKMPAVLGVEGAGVVDAVGAGVKHLEQGNRVGWVGSSGGYADYVVVPATRTVRLPAHIAEARAAAMLFRSVTAHMLFRTVWALRSEQTVLIHAAAGGLGLILTQWAKRLGATVVGTVSSSEKAAVALEHGLDRAILRHDEDFVGAVLDLTHGAGVDLAVDGIGGNTLTQTLDCVRPFGLVASIGQASGSQTELSIADLTPQRSLSFARPSVLRYLNNGTLLSAALAETLAFASQGVKVLTNITLPLEAVGEAHRRLEAGATTGSIVLGL